MKQEQLNDPIYQQFITQVVQNQMVFTLQDEDESFAECPSESYSDDLGEPDTIYCFWHCADAARACQQEEWANYTLTEIQLADFMYENLISMDTAHYLVGVSFDADLFGIEVEPIELLADLLDEIKKCNLIDEFPDFDELQNYRHQWEKIVWQQQIIH